jgi:3-methyladenine DNA glycosylase AlkD
MPNITTPLTSKEFIKRLKKHSSAEGIQKSQRYFKTGRGEYGAGDKFIGVPMGQIFSLAKEFIEMPLSEIEKLLESPIHEVRAGALSIMGQRSRRKKTSDAQRKELFDLYLKRHDRVNNWDLVDLGALYVVGIYLTDKPREILYQLARSKNIWERRTAMVSTGQLIKKGELADTFAIAKILLQDKEDLIHKATGWMLRSAGDMDSAALAAFLDQHAATMPRTALRYSIEKLGQEQKAHYMSLKNSKKK